MQIDVYNQKGEKDKKVKLPGIFDIRINKELIHQVVVSQASNKRQATAHSKDRSEVRGGGRKPWRQKGTGRARHGSIRSPIWKGGGVTFGPSNERNYKKRIPIKMRRQALCMALAGKVKENNLFLIKELEFAKVKTKEMAGFLKVLPLKKGSVLIAPYKTNKQAYLSARNLPNVLVKKASDLTALDILQHKYLIMEKPALDILEKQLEIRN